MNKEKDNTTNEKTIKEDNNMNVTTDICRPCTIEESIINSCKEVKLMQEGKISTRSWKEFAEKMRKQITEDEE